MDPTRVSLPRQVRTDSESYLISVYRCPTRLPRTREEEGLQGPADQEEWGEEQQLFYPPGGYEGGAPEMFGGPGLRRKKLSLERKEKRKSWNHGQMRTVMAWLMGRRSWVPSKVLIIKFNLNLGN